MKVFLCPLKAKKDFYSLKIKKLSLKTIFLALSCNISEIIFTHFTLLKTLREHKTQSTWEIYNDILCVESGHVWYLKNAFSFSPQVFFQVSHY